MPFRLNPAYHAQQSSTPSIAIVPDRVLSSESEKKYILYFTPLFCLHFHPCWVDAELMPGCGPLLMEIAELAISLTAPSAESAEVPGVTGRMRRTSSFAALHSITRVSSSGALQVWIPDFCTTWRLSFCPGNRMNAASILAPARSYALETTKPWQQLEPILGSSEGIAPRRGGGGGGPSICQLRPVQMPIEARPYACSHPLALLQTETQRSPGDVHLERVHENSCRDQMVWRCAGKRHQDRGTLPGSGPAGLCDKLMITATGASG